MAARLIPIPRPARLVGVPERLAPGIAHQELRWGETQASHPSELVILDHFYDPDTDHLVVRSVNFQTGDVRWFTYAEG